MFPSSTPTIQYNPLIASAARRTKCPTCNMQVKKFVPIYLNLVTGNENNKGKSKHYSNSNDNSNDNGNGNGNGNNDKTNLNSKKDDDDDDDDDERLRLEEDLKKYKIMAAVSSKKCAVTLKDNELLRTNLARARVSSTEQMIALNRYELLRKNLIRSKQKHDVHFKVLRNEIRECRTKLVTQKITYAGLNSTEKIKVLARYCRHRRNHNNNQPSTILIFTTKTPYENIFEVMNRAGVSSLSAIHEDQNQREREAVITKFRTGRITIVMTTDVAAAAVQNLDVMGINEVINLDMPDSIDIYKHRCAFARSTGAVISFIDEGDIGIIRDLIDCLNVNRQDVPQWLLQMYLHNSTGQLKDYGTSTTKGGGDASANDSRFPKRSFSTGQTYQYDRQIGIGITSANTINYENVLGAAERGGQGAPLFSSTGVPLFSSADDDYPYTTNSNNSSDGRLERTKSSDSDIDRSSCGDKT